MKRVRWRYCLLVAALLVGADAAVCGEFLASEGVPQGAKLVQEEGQVGDALARARDSLRDAMQAFGDAGRLTLDRQLPKLKDRTDEVLQGTQKLLNRWEERFGRELDRRSKRSEVLPSLPEEEQEDTEGAQNI